MKNKFKLGIVGAGFMATAIINGILDSKVIEPSGLIVSDKYKQSLDKLACLNVNTTLDNEYLFDNCEFVLFAVKPQSFASDFSVAKEYNCKKYISIMAGVKKDKIKSKFLNSLVARCMPNTPCSICSGAVGVDISDYTDNKDIEFINSILNSFAVVVKVKENDLNTVTGISGSSPAYFYLFVKGIIDAGVKNGLSMEDSFNLAVSTMIGSGKMLLKNKDKSIDELINNVCSKGGTTIEAVNTYKENGLNEITKKAIDACIKRASELENL